MSEAKLKKQVKTLLGVIEGQGKRYVHLKEKYDALLLENKRLEEELTKERLYNYNKK